MSRFAARIESPSAIAHVLDEWNFGNISCDEGKGKAKCYKRR
jgi:hypothetical protein